MNISGVGITGLSIFDNGDGPPVNTAVPVISGTVTIGSTLTSSTGTWTGTPTPTFAYQWQQGTTPISGATASTYVIQAADYNNTIRCVVTATNTSGTVQAVSANTVVVPAVAPVNTAVPTISGTVAIGSTLTSTTGTWTGTPTPTFAYEWQQGTTPIAGATASTYVIQAADYNSTLRCVVTATNPGGSVAATSANTATVPAQAPVNTAVPTISGTVAIGSTLTSTTGTWTGAPTPTYAYEWQQGTTPISGATASTYVIQAADAGFTLRCVVTATNAGGSASANSADTVAVPAVPGQVEFTTAGTFSWTAPAGVTSVCVVAVGGGGGGVSTTAGGNGGGGGGLGWKNNIAVVPGTSYTVTVGAGGTSGSAATSTNGGQSLFIDAATVAGNGGGRATSATASTALGGTFVGDGGGNGGRGSRSVSTATAGGGGGAGGYAGAGGQANAGSATGTAGLGGGGGGGGGGGTSDTAGAGGGVGLLGEGANGAGGAGTTADGRGGFGGSGGTDAAQASTSTTAVNVYSTTVRSTPGVYGGGAAGSDVSVNETTNGAVGAVRIIWGAGRAFPNTNTGDV
jgi:hypothetical protein